MLLDPVSLHAQMAVLLVVAGTLVVFRSWGRLRLRRMVVNLATSRVRSVAMGLAELKGRARVIRKAQLSPVRKMNCVWSLVEVTKEWTDYRGERKTSRLLRREARVPFLLEDETGRILVLPEGAEISGVATCNSRVFQGTEPGADVREFCDMNGIPWRVSAGVGVASYLVQEWVILADAEVYVLGGVEKLHSSVRDRRWRVVEKLRELKRSPERMAAIDTSGDGEIQPEEWEAARDWAQEEVIKEDLARASSSTPLVVRKSPQGFFLVWSGLETDVLAGLGRPGRWVLAGLAMVVGGLKVMPDPAAVSREAWLQAGVVAAIGAVGLVLHWRRRR